MGLMSISALGIYLPALGCTVLGVPAPTLAVAFDGYGACSMQEGAAREPLSHGAMG